MNNKTRIIDLNVGQFLQLLNNRELLVKEPKQDGYDVKEFEKEIINEYLERPEKMEDIQFKTATFLKDYIELKSEGKIKVRNIKWFGIELRKQFGKPVQKRGIGFCYQIKFKLL